MNDLILIKSEMFGSVNCDFYQNCKKQIAMTSEQLGTALDYANPRESVNKLVSRHEYLRQPEFSGEVKLTSTDGKAYETRIFYEDGIYEVTMLAKTEKAKEFRAWVRKILKALRVGEVKLISKADERATELKLHELEIKAKNAEARLKNAQVRQSKFILEEADKRKVNLAPEAYELLLINGFESVVGKNTLPRPKLETELYDATAIAERLGILSSSKLPHAQAVGAILSKLDITESERTVTAFDRNGHQGSTYQYKPSVLAKVKEWLDANNYPAEIPYTDTKGNAKAYKVIYH